MKWSGWWDEFLFRLIDLVKTADILRAVEWNRNVNDESITIQDQKRDFLLWGRDTLLVCGEDKFRSTLLANAKVDLLRKNKGRVDS